MKKKSAVLTELVKCRAGSHPASSSCFSLHQSGFSNQQDFLCTVIEKLCVRSEKKFYYLLLHDPYSKII